MTTADHQFIDADGRLHTLRVDTWTCRRAKDELGIGLGEIYTGHLTTRLVAEPELLGDLLYLVSGTDDEPADFARAVAPVLDDASRALVVALSDFFDRLTGGAAGRVARASRETLHTLHQIAADRATATTREDLETLIDTVLERMSSGQTSGLGPASAESTPAPTPTESFS